MGYQITYPGWISRAFGTVPVRKKTGRILMIGAIVAASVLFAFYSDNVTFLPGDQLVTKQAIVCFASNVREDMPLMEAFREFCMYIISNGK